MDGGDNHVYDVIVVGGGVAGLRTLENLYGNNVKNVLLLEALDRLGGRVQTIWLNDDINVPLELGANWIHGLTGNPLYELVKQNPEKFVSYKKNSFNEDVALFVDVDGNSYESDMCTELTNLFEVIIEDSRKFWMEQIPCQFNNFEEFSMSKFEEHIKNDTDEEKRVKRMFIRNFLKIFCIEVGCYRMSDCDVKDYGSYIRYDNTDYEFPGGYSNFVKYLAEKVPADRIKLKSAVESISVVNENDKNQFKLSIKCTNGEQYNTRHVVLTCSLNYLKTNYSTLLNNISLNQRKLDALDKTKMGYVNKILLVYDDMSFYPKSVDSLHVLFENDFDNYDITTQWYLKICKFDKFFDNVLRVFLTGDEAIFIESLSENEIAGEITNLLRKCMKNEKIPLPSRVIRTKWCTNKYLLGSYSYMAVGSSVDQIVALAEPVYYDEIPRIMFAGEATNEKYYSTVHGAYLSGEREAQRLLDYFNKENK